MATAKYSTNTVYTLTVDMTSTEYDRMSELLGRIKNDSSYNPEMRALASSIWSAM